MVVKVPKWLRWLVDFEIIYGEDLNPKVKAAKLKPYLKKSKEEVPIVEKSKEEEPMVSAKNKENLIKRIEVILQKVQAEYYKFPYLDKYKSYVCDHNGYEAKCVDYKFENGDRAKFIVLNVQDITGEYIFEVTFIPLNGSQNSTKSYGQRLYYMAKALLVQITNKSMERLIKVEKTTNDTTKDRYNLIVRKIKIREAELAKITEKAPTYAALSNELSSYKRMADKLKKQL